MPFLLSHRIVHDSISIIPTENKNIRENTWATKATLVWIKSNDLWRVPRI